MTELDFEELDKAVAGLMSNVDTNKRNPALDDPEDKVVNLSSSIDQKAPDEGSSVPEAAAPLDARQPNATPSEPSTASLAVKRRGRFMDMVHPSSNMKSAPGRPNRQGVTLAPLDAASSRVASRTSTDVARPSIHSLSNNEPTQTIAAEIPSTPVTPTPIVQTVEQPELPNEPSVQSVVDESSEASLSSAPLVSPFLPDAKPEKRPLGGLAPDDEREQTEPSHLIEMPAVSQQNDSLPEELNNDVLAVESNDLSGHEQELAVPAETSEEPQAASSEDSAIEKENDTKAAAPAVEPVEEPQATTDIPSVPAGGSIAQQYTESPSTGDQTTGSIYDTANYHQAITAATPAKKKPSMLKWILIGLGLIVLGGGAGVGYFLLTH